MKNFLRLTAFFAFILFLILPTLVWGGLKLASSDITKSDYIEQTENRKPAVMPEKFSLKTFPSDFEAYYNDRLPFRTNIILVKNDFFDAVEKPYNEVIQPFLINLFHPAEDDENDSHVDVESPQNNFDENTPGYCNHNNVALETVEATYENMGYTLYECTICGLRYKGDIVGKLIDDTYMPPRVFNDLVIEGRFNWLFYSGNNSVGYYKGTNVLTNQQMDEWIVSMNALKKICDEKGIKLQFMIMPNKEQVYPEYMPSYTVTATEKRVPVLVDYISRNSDIDIIYPLEELENAKNHWQVYYKHDTHWNAAGAFIGLQSLYRSLGMETTDLNTLKITERNKEDGDLIKIGGLSEASYNIDTGYNIEYKPDVAMVAEDKSVNEAVFATSESANEENFVMVGDSFRKQMLPFLKKDFSSCSVFHKDMIENEKCRQAIKQADTLVISTVERNDSSILEVIGQCIQILSGY